MISTIKTKFNLLNSSRFSSAGSQDGVSLMLAVLVLSAITAVVFSLATIVFIEIRSAGDASRTEPALYATFGVTEEALFQYKRFYEPPQGDSNAFNVATCSGPQSANVCKINGVTLSLPGSQPLAFDDSPRVEFVPAGSVTTIPLYTINNFDRQYQSVTLEVLPNSSSSSIDFFFRAVAEDGSINDTSPVSLSPEDPPYTFQSFVNNAQYELILDNDNVAQDLSVSITTVRMNNAQPDGLPFVGEQVLRILADYLGLTRTYQVRIPIP